jgi:hypothetical protein
MTQRLGLSAAAAAITALALATPNAMAASLELSASGGAVAETPMTITASGTADDGDLLYIEAEEAELVPGFSRTCLGFPLTSISSVAKGVAVGPGVFSQAFSFTPPKGGKWLLCGYLQKASFDFPVAAKFEGSVAVAPLSGTVSITASPNPVSANSRTMLSVTGTTNAATRLFVKRELTSSCFGLVTGTSDLTPATGDPVGPGGYSRSYTFTPTYPGESDTFCAYLGHSASSLLVSFVSGSVTVTARTEQEEEAGRQEAAAREREQAAAEFAARRAAALSRPVRKLSVHAVSHNGGTSGDPGYANLDVATSPFAHVTVRLSRYGHATYHIEWGEHTAAVAVVIPWSCRSPSGTYRYVVTARTNVGHALVRKGRFSPVSVARCHLLERQEAEAREQENREAREKYEREVQAERQRVEHFEHNCRVLGGTPVVIEVGGEPRIYCRGPNGGILLVPH